MREIILASASPRRRELLEKLGVKFTIIVSSEDENTDKSIGAELYVSELAILKANSVAKQITQRKNAIIISADTIVCLDGEILTKPKDYNDAFGMLKRLSGNTHTVYTGICVMRMSDAKMLSKSVATDVTFKKLSDEMINKYLSLGEYKDKAGSYAIQEKGCVLVEKINGDYNNVVGLPVSELYDMLKDEFGIDIF